MRGVACPRSAGRPRPPFAPQKVIVVQGTAAGRFHASCGSCPRLPGAPRICGLLRLRYALGAPIVAVDAHPHMTDDSRSITRTVPTGDGRRVVIVRRTGTASGGSAPRLDGLDQTRIVEERWSVATRRPSCDLPDHRGLRRDRALRGATGRQPDAPGRRRTSPPRGSQPGPVRGARRPGRPLGPQRSSSAWWASWSWDPTITMVFSDADLIDATGRPLGRRLWDTRPGGGRARCASGRWRPRSCSPGAPSPPAARWRSDVGSRRIAPLPPGAGRRRRADAPRSMALPGRRRGRHRARPFPNPCWASGSTPTRRRACSSAPSSPAALGRAALGAVAGTIHEDERGHLVRPHSSTWPLPGPRTSATSRRQPPCAPSPRTTGSAVGRRTPRCPNACATSPRASAAARTAGTGSAPARSPATSCGRSARTARAARDAAQAAGPHGHRHPPGGRRRAGGGRHRQHARSRHPRGPVLRDPQ